MAFTHADWLAAEPFTLALSAGFFGFYAHAGLLRALAERQIAPQRLVGVSAGALVGGLYAAGLAPAAIEAELFGLQREQFWDPGWSATGLLRGELFAARLAQVVAPTGVVTLQDCRRPFSAVVFDVFDRCTRVLHDGPLVAAIRASCALPGLFRPVRVAGRWCLDGGIADRPGSTGLAPDERVLVHSLVSNSPWRRFFRAPTWSPQAHRRVLELRDLPRVTPFQLSLGRVANELAYESAQRWLDSH